VGGLISTLLLGMFVLPALYLLKESARVKIRKRKLHPGGGTNILPIPH